MDDPNGFSMRDSPQTETVVFSPNGTVHTVDLRSPSGILYGAQARRRGRCLLRIGARLGATLSARAQNLARLTLCCRMCVTRACRVPTGKQVHSEYGADRTYTGETYNAYSAGQRVSAMPDAALPPSALRRSMSSRVGGMGLAAEETPAKLKRKVSWAGTTVRARADAVRPCGPVRAAKKAPTHFFAHGAAVRSHAPCYPNAALRRGAAGRGARNTPDQPRAAPMRSTARRARALIP
jgi:hypothetical protein